MLQLQRQGESEGQRVVLFNPLGSVSAVWRPLIRALEPRFEVVTFEYPGFGGAPFQPFQTIEDLAGRIACALAELPARPTHLIGASFGSWVAQQVACQAPEKAASLTLLGSSTRIFEQGVQMIGAWLEMMERMGLQALLTQLAFWSFSPLTFEAKPGTTQNYVKASLAGCADPSAYRAQLEACTRFRAGAPLERLRAPALVLHGALDIFYPPFCARMLAQAIPGSKLVTIPDAAHAALWENPGPTLAAIVDFLEGAGR